MNQDLNTERSIVPVIVYWTFVIAELTDEHVLIIVCTKWFLATSDVSPSEVLLKYMVPSDVWQVGHTERSSRHCSGDCILDDVSNVTSRLTVTCSSV